MIGLGCSPSSVRILTRHPAWTDGRGFERQADGRHSKGCGRAVRGRPSRAARRLGLTRAPLRFPVAAQTLTLIRPEANLPRSWPTSEADELSIVDDQGRPTGPRPSPWRAPRPGRARELRRRGPHQPYSLVIFSKKRKMPPRHAAEKTSATRLRRERDPKRRGAERLEPIWPLTHERK